jgi:hypothetical protein
MYIVIAISIYKNGLSVSRLLVTTSVVIFTNFLITIPQFFLFTLSHPMSYEVSQIFTVTLYHANCVVNPVIYFVANPRISHQIKASVIGETLKSISERIRVFSLNILVNAMWRTQNVGNTPQGQGGAQ